MARTVRGGTTTIHEEGSALAGATYTHDGITVEFGEEGFAASDTTVNRAGTEVYSTTDHVVAPTVGALGTVIGPHLIALGESQREVTWLDTFVECTHGGETFYHWLVSYAGEPVRLPQGVVSFD
jgi:hypothetical protein